MSRIVVDRQRCASTGGCEAVAPDVFEIADDGELVVHRPEPDEGDLPDVREAVRTCPTLALTLVDGPRPG
ncbi:MAG: putative ferredoxin [Frankiales bacterium]|nr:putative ferredoxin [Frankiales bacterium]